jgi:GntR family transcriptional repressor for pyruvate dehydrogenase complex
VADQITSLIAKEEFHPGQRLPAERELAVSLDVSRPTIREAMIALEIAGVINIRPGAGNFVAVGGPGESTRISEDIGPGPFELIEARIMFEGEAAALAASRISETELERLEAANRKLEDLYDQGKPGEGEDWKFHRTIAQATRNSAVLAAIDQLWSYRTRMPMWRKLHEIIRAIEARPGWSDDRRAALDHRKIVAALRSRDPVRARGAMHDHLERVRDVLLAASEVDVQALNEAAGRARGCGPR